MKLIIRHHVVVRAYEVDELGRLVRQRDLELVPGQRLRVLENPERGTFHLAGRGWVELPRRAYDLRRRRRR